MVWTHRLSEVPWARGVHWPVVLQPSQDPLHDVAQQTLPVPSGLARSQCPLWHSPAPVHACPSCFVPPLVLDVVLEVLDVVLEVEVAPPVPVPLLLEVEVAPPVPVLLLLLELAPPPAPPVPWAR